MSFRLFIYYCAWGGGLAALVGWALGRLVPDYDSLGQAGLKGMFLGMLVALGLALIDALWDRTPGRLGRSAVGILLAALVGAAGGVMGGMVGQALYAWFARAVFLVLGWAITGLLTGTALGVFALLRAVQRAEELRPAWRKMAQGGLGGAVGGVLGGILLLVLKSLFGRMFPADTLEQLRSPSATGFVVLGACIGLAVGLTRVILKEGWLRVEKGFRAGRELILSRSATTMGRGEECDVGLFGDPSVEKLHARIVRSGRRFTLVDAGTKQGTLLNGKRIARAETLRSGDTIEVGRSVLRFGERQRRANG